MFNIFSHSFFLTNTILINNYFKRIKRRENLSWIRKKNNPNLYLLSRYFNLIDICGETLVVH